MRQSVRAVLVVAVVTAAVASVAACSSAKPGPDVAAGTFLRGLSSGDSTTAAGATDQPEAARTAIDAARTALAPESVETALQQVTTTGDSATAAFTATWKLKESRQWSYSGTLALIRTKDTWSVRWSNADLNPKLAANQTLALRVDSAPTASVLDRNGQAVLTPGVVVQVVLDPKAAGDTSTVATSLAAALVRFDPTITALSILAGVASGGTAPYTVISLRESDYQQVKSAIYDLPGVTFPTQARLLAADKTFAPTVMSQVQSAVEADLDGKAGWRVVTVGPNGADIETLTSTPSAAAPAVALTLDRGVQSAAQNAVNGQQLPAVSVAIQASTGQLLAVAQNPAADRSGAIALSGLYPPGSTFKVVTAAAALSAGIASADTPTDCPGTTVIGGVRVIPNYNMFALGTVPLRTAFAASCNTTFAQLSATLPADALTTMAAKFGLGRDYVLKGVTTVTGTVPPTADLVTRAVDAIGQGDVVASPFGMALVAATAAHGSTPVPSLVQGSTTTTKTQSDPVSPSVLAQLKVMMREVVTGGSGRAVAPQGEVYGKTGEAQFGDGTQSHAWFIGYRGDVAFATLIVGGGSSGSAVKLTGQFLNALPAGY